MAIVFDGSTFEIVGQVTLPVKELAADTGIGQDAFIPIALQGAFGDVQYPAYVCTVHIPVRGLRIEPAAYLQGKGGQLFQLVEKMRSCLLPDAYYLFHRFIVFCSTIGLSMCAIGWFSLIADSVRPVFHHSTFLCVSIAVAGRSAYS